MQGKRRCMSIEVVYLIVATICWSAPATPAEPLFAGDSILDLSIHGPLTSLAAGAPGDTGVAGWIELEDGEPIPVTISTYGISRVRECEVPLFKIEVAEEHARDTPLEGQSSVRLVTPCHHQSKSDKHILLEYLAYKSWAVIAEPALRVRLVSCRFRDSNPTAAEETGLAFFLEDIGAAAARYGKTWLDTSSQSIADLSPEHCAVLALFQFMVGNTDWSALASAAGERCCHNVAILGAEGDPHNTLLPFDFDQAGLVNAPYAAPDERLPIQSVTQRVYRGLCSHNDHLTHAIAVFNERRPELEMLFNQDGLPNPKARKRALKYIDAFYDTINDPRKVEKRIIGDCR